MTDQTQVTWADLAGFSDTTSTEMKTAFNDAIGGAYFDIGSHKGVKIDSIEPKKGRQSGNLYFRVTFSNDDGATINKNVFIKNKKGEYHFTYKQLAAAVVKDPQLRMEAFINKFSEQPQLLDCLRGLKVNIKIKHGDTGYIIKKDAVADGFLLIDSETGKPYDEVKSEIFEDYTAAKEAANELGVSRCYNEVDKLTQYKDALEANEEAVREALRSTGKGGAVKARTARAKSAAVRPTL